MSPLNIPFFERPRGSEDEKKIQVALEIAAERIVEHIDSFADRDIESPDVSELLGENILIPVSEGQNAELISYKPTVYNVVPGEHNSLLYIQGYTFDFLSFLEALDLSDNRSLEEKGLVIALDEENERETFYFLDRNYEVYLERLLMRIRENSGQAIITGFLDSNGEISPDGMFIYEYSAEPEEDDEEYSQVAPFRLVSKIASQIGK
jgi:hypothetical protein